MSLWKVRQAEDLYWDEGDNLCRGPRWCVTSPTGVSWGNYATHAEALAYADKKARTIEVTLPLGAKSVTLGPNAWAELRPDGGATMNAPAGSIGIRKIHMETVALALLAHARRNQ